MNGVKIQLPHMLPCNQRAT